MAAHIGWQVPLSASRFLKALPCEAINATTHYELQNARIGDDAGGVAFAQPVAPHLGGGRAGASGWHGGGCGSQASGFSQQSMSQHSSSRYGGSQSVRDESQREDPMVVPPQDKPTGALAARLKHIQREQQARKDRAAAASASKAAKLAVSSESVRKAASKAVPMDKQQPKKKRAVQEGSPQGWNPRSCHRIAHNFWVASKMQVTQRRTTQAHDQSGGQSLWTMIATRTSVEVAHLHGGT